MISVTDQANNANGRPGEAAANSTGVASKTPQTTITRLRTWKIVIIGFDGTKPVTACIICKSEQ